MVDLISQEGPILVAPRPMRIASGPAPFSPNAPFHPRPAPIRLVPVPQAVDAFDRMSLGDDLPASPARSPALSESSSPSPMRSASRPSMEAIEEFLSILKPAPALQSAFSAPFLPRRSATVAGERSPIGGRFSPMRVSHSIVEEDAQLTGSDKENVLVARTWGPYGPLGSPVSRTHTRNPFFRHPSYEVAAPQAAPDMTFGHIEDISSSPSLRVPTPPMPQASPASVPLPSPTPDEMPL